MGMTDKRQGTEIRLSTFSCIALAAVALTCGLGEATAASGGVSFAGRVTAGGAGGLSLPATETISFTDKAGMQLIVSNPGGLRRKLQVKVYDSRFRSIDAETFPANIMLEAGASSQVTIIVPFAGSDVRDLNICAERVISGGTRRQACSRYKIRRVSLDQ